MRSASAVFPTPPIPLSTASATASPLGRNGEPEPLPQPLPTDEVARRRRELLRAGGGRDLLDPCGRGPVGFGGGA